MIQLLANGQLTIALLEQKSLKKNALAAYHFCSDWLQGKESFIIKTSGSTGVAKDIELSREQMIASALNSQKILKITPYDHMHVCLSVEHIGGLMQLVRALYFNLNVYIYEPKIDVLDTIVTMSGINHISLVPAMIETYIQKKHVQDILQNFATILIGGAYISSTIENYFSSHISQAFQTYGMTETCSNIALRSLNKREKTYKLLDGWQYKLSSENCLFLYHPTILKKWIETKDIVDINSDHRFTVKGRLDFIINSGGLKYSPEELEYTLHTSGLFLTYKYVVSSIPDKVWGEKLVLVLETDFHLLDQFKLEILNKINSLLTQNIIKEIKTMPQFIYTNSNKIDRLKIKEYIENL